jgi:hypothetical protein
LSVRDTTHWQRHTEWRWKDGKWFTKQAETENKQD